MRFLWFKGTVRNYLFFNNSCRFKTCRLYHLLASTQSRFFHLHNTTNFAPTAALFFPKTFLLYINSWSVRTFSLFLFSRKLLQSFTVKAIMQCHCQWPDSDLIWHGKHNLSKVTFENNSRVVYFFHLKALRL